MSPQPDAPRLPLWPVLVALALVITWAMTSLAPRDVKFCPACPGHREPVNECLCYHVPLTADSLPH